MRLNKYISETGLCPRREADALIEAGRVTINGAIATLGMQVHDGELVCVDGQPVGGLQKHVYLALNKPVGVICTTDREIPGNITDFVGYPERVFPVGRLDKDSEGLILLTNDGDLANEILCAGHGHEKEYVVTVDRTLTEFFLGGMAGGVRILGTLTRPCQIKRVGPATFRIILTQGLNRQIRRMCACFGYKVLRLQRVRIINLTLDGLEIGQWRTLTESEVRGLLSAGTRGRQ